ncbi:MAG: MBL fold metallo-hydrolase [Proteobacteria bacterium]|nr:MBL fold metallo-hydrolase [Pseudomonadota bacterium]
MRLTFLGTGTSHGVPMIGCQCDVCTSPDPKNHRLRTCLLIQHDGTNVVIDTGPEFRLQALRARLDHLDAVLLTHAHSDHIMGLDDVRAFNMRQGTPMPVYGSPATLGEVRHRFSYAFTDGPEGGGRPKIELCPVDTPFTHGSLRITPLDVRHGREIDIVTAFRVTATSCSPDMISVDGWLASEAAVLAIK